MADQNFCPCAGSRYLVPTSCWYFGLRANLFAVEGSQSVLAAFYL